MSWRYCNSKTALAWKIQEGRHVFGLENSTIMILVFKHFQNFILHPSFLWHFCLNWHRWIWQRSAWFSTEQKHWIIVIIGILLPKLFWPTVRKNCSSDREKLLKFKAEGREFAKFLRSLEQFIQTVQWKVRTIFGNRRLFNLFLEVFHI